MQDTDKDKSVKFADMLNIDFEQMKEALAPKDHFVRINLEKFWNLMSVFYLLSSLDNEYTAYSKDLGKDIQLNSLGKDALNLIFDKEEKDSNSERFYNKDKGSTYNCKCAKCGKDCYKPEREQDEYHGRKFFEENTMRVVCVLHENFGTLCNNCYEKNKNNI